MFERAAEAVQSFLHGRDPFFLCALALAIAKGPCGCHSDDAEPIFSNAFENGFRYYVHAPDTVPYLVSEGISVSPGTRVYSAISTNTVSATTVVLFC